MIIKAIRWKSAIASLLTALMAVIGYAGPSQAAGYIKFEGIDGEATDPDHDDWIDILSCCGAQAAGDQSSSGMALEIALDAGSVSLADYFRSGRGLGRVELDLCEGTPASICDTTQVGDQHCYLKYTLANVKIVNYSVSGEVGDGRLPVSIELEYDKLDQLYTPAPTQCPDVR